MFDIEAVKKRLSSFGYEVRAEEESSALAFCIDKVRNMIKGETNQNDVPEGLEQVAVDMACGEFLFFKKTFAPNDLTSLDLDVAVKEISVGDTKTSFAFGSGSMTPEQRLNTFIDYLLNYGKPQFAAYRRLKW